MFTRQFYKDILLAIVTVAAVLMLLHNPADFPADEDGAPSTPAPSTRGFREVELDVVPATPIVDDTSTTSTTATDIGEPLVIDRAVTCDTFFDPYTVSCVDGNTGEVVASYPQDQHPVVSYEQGCMEDEVLWPAFFGYDEWVQGPDGLWYGVGESYTEYVCMHPDNL